MAGRVALGGASVDRTETGWDRPSESAPRWRALLDRALLGRTGEQAPVNGGTQIITPRSPATYDPAAYLPPADYERPGYGPQDYPQDYGPATDYQRPVDYERAAYDRGAGYPPRSPYPAEIEWRQPQVNGAAMDRDIDVLRRDLGGPRVVAFANPKGGVHKTTATVLAAATVGSVRGRGVLAWDDNELRGTLGLRAGSARHARTIRHLVADLADVESYHGFDLIEQLDDYLRHASDGSYDVLAGEENPRFAQRLDQFTVRRVLELLRRTHDVICVDTGNNVESANWQTVLQVADQLVLTTVPREDAAFSADWMLDLLEEIGLGHLVANAVTLLSCPTPNPTPLLDDLASHFGARTRAVAIVPYDPSLEAGSSIEYELLQPATKKAWLAAAAMMLEPFAR
jgi:MinD-like ATPase involved in chromosome partitioning or flagellar assembly